MGLKFSIQSNREVLNETKSTIKLKRLRILNPLTKFHPSYRRPLTWNRRRKNGIRRLLGGEGVLCSTAAMLLSWPWMNVAPQEETAREEEEEEEPKSEERKLAKILPPKDDSKRLFEQLGYTIFIFIAFCMVIEVFLMDEDRDGSTPSSSSDS